jgi:cytochrome oxidase Cu insertion factor (SCO1/SenC/PrrC family)
MFRPTILKLLTSAPLMLVTFAVLTLPARADELPRYRLKVGQELTFSADNHVERMRAESKRETVTWTVWVIGKAGDDGWKLVVRHDYSARYTDPSRAGRTVEHSEVYPVEFGSDGRLLLDSDLGADLFGRVRNCFPMLPKDHVQVQNGYEEKSEAFGFRYRVVKRDGPWEIAAVSQSLYSEINEIDSNTTYLFDAERGIPIQATMKSEQKDFLKTRLEGTLRLKSVKDHDAAWAAQAAADAKQYFAAKRLLIQTYVDCKLDSMKKAKESLESVQGRLVKSELFQKHIETDLENLERDIKGRENGGSEPVFLGKTVDWTTTDLDGKKVKLADFKGKIVVLDYWYRGCFWCVRSMPQLNEVVDDADARFVIKKMGLQYATLKAGSTGQDYGVQAFPTMLILDDKGTVCDLHIGYTADMKETLIKKIDKLLNEHK